MGSPAPLYLHVGCGTQLYRGWVNLDPRRVGSDDPTIDVRRGDALHLDLEDKSVAVVFSNAMFEHVFFAQHGDALREWARVLTPDGMIATIGIPDFEAVCRLYLARADGITGRTFDLFESHRYVCGFAEGHLWEQGYRWEWDTAATPDTAPSGYLPQMHKAVFDSDYLVALLAHVGLSGQVFRYAYVGEPHALNLGFVAGHEPRTVDDLEQLPFLAQYVEPGSLELVTVHRPSRMVKILARLERGR